MFGFGFPYNTINPSSDGGAAFDPDAEAFFTASGITDTTQKNAVNQLVLDLKTYNIWTKMKAIYPIVGGTASTHKWNLKDPRDLNAAYRLTFATGWTHSSTGMTPNGSSAYADTFFNPSTASTLNSTHLSFYSRTANQAASMYDIGYFSNPNLFGLSAGYQGSAYSDHYNYSTGRVTYNSSPSALGFWVGSRTTSAVHKLFRNGTQVGATNTGASGSFVSLNLWIGGYNVSGVLGVPSIKQCAFASIGDGLTDAEASNFRTAVQAYQTTLSRQV